MTLAQTKPCLMLGCDTFSITRLRKVHCGKKLWHVKLETKIIIMIIIIITIIIIIIIISIISNLKCAAL